MDGNKSRRKWDRKERGINPRFLCKGDPPRPPNYQTNPKITSFIPTHWDLEPSKERNSFAPLFAAFPFLPFPVRSWITNFPRQKETKGPGAVPK